MAEPQYDQRSMRRRMLGVITPVNLSGAVLIFIYYRWVDHHALAQHRMPTAGELIYFVVAFAVLAYLGYRLNVRWSAPVRQSLESEGVLTELARRRALQVPFAAARISAIGWLLATIIWGVVWPLIDGTFSVAHALRMMLGMLMAASLVVAAVFFLVERIWRKALPALFPEGGLSEVKGVRHVSVRARLIVIFLLSSVIPVAMLGVMAYNHARAALADPARSDAIIQTLAIGIVFVAAACTLGALRMAFFVSGSVAGPLRSLESAMAEVERGRLDTRCPVVSTDEIGRVTDGFNRMVRGLQEREMLRETFGKYVSQEIRDEILAGRVALEGQVREATILFADLRDFTTWVEASDPRDVVRDLNSYFTEMETAIRGQGGLVLQYIGDEIEAVFGAPVDKPDHAAAAVRAAGEMRRRLAAWNAARRASGKPTLRHGIGVHTGTVVAGNIGSSERLSYALVGDPVNLASRLQGLTKELAADVLVSGTTRARVGEELSLRPLPAVRVKGRKAEVEVYALD
jgi:class 3 adenylate cyclase